MGAGKTARGDRRRRFRPVQCGFIPRLLIASAAAGLFAALAVHWSSAPARAQQGEGSGQLRGRQTGQKPSLEEEIDRRLRSRKERAQQEDEEAPPKPPLEFLAFRTRPAGAVSYFKPRHWTSMTQELIANDGDFAGRLGAGPLWLGQNSRYQARVTRAAPLAEGQKRNLEILLFPSRESSNGSVNLVVGLYGRSMLAPQRWWSTPMPQMHAHQFFFVVLTKDPERYNKFRNLRSINPNLEQGLPDSGTRHYQISQPDQPDGPGSAPFSSHPLAWSPIAYVLWDNYDPANLSDEQQQAMIDWLHWGGQLILSGHATLLDLRGSFLDAYLPAEQDGTLELTELEELSRRFPGPRITGTSSPAAVDAKQANPAKIYLSAEEPLLASRLKLRPEALALVETEQGAVVVAERRVGRGRIVLCAFRISERPVAVWRGFDDFFNALLLRRPGRETVGNQADGYTEWLGWRSGTLRPRWISQVRYFTRDTIAEPFEDRWGAEEAVAVAVPESAAALTPAVAQGIGGYAGSPSWVDQYRGPRVAEWDDFNAVSSAAREILHDASGIAVPRGTFVFQWVLAYLVLLVPVNWMIFRTMRRVEWAWVAAPLIALGFTLALLKTHLNIGFTRAVTAIGVVEAYGGYPRAHVTRYTAVYTSTRARYQFSYDERTAVALPFPLQGEGVRGQESREVVLRWDDPVRLEEMLLDPNSLGMVHAEQMLDLKGEFQWQPSASDSHQGTLTNATLLNLNDVVVVSPSQGDAQLGPLQSGATVQVTFAGSAQEKPLSGSAAQRATLSGRWPEDRAPKAAESVPSEPEQVRGEATLSVERLVDLARATCPPGEVRLIGWTAVPVGGQEIEPRAVQQRSATVVVVHLSPAPLPAPGKDAPWTMPRDDFGFGDETGFSDSAENPTSP